VKLPSFTVIEPENLEGLRKVGSPTDMSKDV